tara:strand:- start:12695 stop:13054 length:360 start_codon:yes stop_codon:yes gene_type:complete
MIKLLANENFPLAGGEIIRSAGFDIKAIGVDFSGIFDYEVIDLAIKERRLILTFDRDYGELIFKKGYCPEAGVVYLRWNNYRPDEQGKYLLELFDVKKIRFEGMLTVISERSVRQPKFV